MIISSPWVEVPDPILQAVGQKMEERPDLVRTVCGHSVLPFPVPANWPGRMVADATEICVGINNTGAIQSLSERRVGCDGGYMGSCIPPAFLVRALKAWLMLSESSQQPDLFGAPA